MNDVRTTLRDGEDEVVRGGWMTAQVVRERVDDGLGERDDAARGLGLGWSDVHMVPGELLDLLLDREGPAQEVDAADRTARRKTDRCQRRPSESPASGRRTCHRRGWP
jgi:hypothetical protein